MVDAEVVRDPISTLHLVISPDARASLQISLVAEIVVTGVDDEEHDLTLNFLALRPPSVAALQRLVPEIADVSANLSNAQIFLGLASASKRMRSEDLKGIEPRLNALKATIRKLQLYRISSTLGKKSINLHFCKQQL